MSIELRIIYLLAIFAEILAIFLQALIKRKNLPVFYDTIKGGSVTTFLIAMLCLNVIDFLNFDKDVMVAEYIVVAYTGIIIFVWLKWILLCAKYLKACIPRKQGKEWKSFDAHAPLQYCIHPYSRIGHSQYNKGDKSAVPGAGRSGSLSGYRKLAYARRA